MQLNSNIILSYWSPVKITSELLLNAMKEMAPLYAKGRLVDLGCGTQPYEKIFEKYIDSYFGIDFKPSAEANYKDKTRADLYCDCTDTRLDSESFDTILSTQVMEQVFDTNKYIAECYRLLKVGGYGIFTVLHVWESYENRFDYYRFTRFSIEKLFRQHGFQIVELNPICGAYAALQQAKIVSLYLRKIDNIFIKILQKLYNFFAIPITNWKALHLDRIFWNDKFPISYLVVTTKTK